MPTDPHASGREPEPRTTSQPLSYLGGALFVCQPMKPRDWMALPTRQRFSTMDMDTSFNKERIR